MLYITIEGSIAFRPPPSIVRRSLGSINDLGQVTPLKRALRRHAAEAIVRLLDADAMVQGDDPSGWTTMQIAAYEGAARSVPILLPLGADTMSEPPSSANRHPS